VCRGRNDDVQSWLKPEIVGDLAVVLVLTTSSSKLQSGVIKMCCSQVRRHSVIFYLHTFYNNKSIGDDTKAVIFIIELTRFIQFVQSII